MKNKKPASRPASFDRESWSAKKRIIPQMFDVRPVDEAGDLDWEKIENDIGVISRVQQWVQIKKVM